MSNENEKKPVKSAAKTPAAKKTAAKAPATKAVDAAAKPDAKATPKKTAAAPKTAAAAPKKAATPKPTAAAKAATAAGIPEVAASGTSRRQPTHDEIAYRAYFIFVGRGGNHGQHEDDWRRAEQELLGLF